MVSVPHPAESQTVLLLSSVVEATQEDTAYSLQLLAEEAIAMLKH